MPHFCHQVSYTSSAWTRVSQNAHDRFQAVRAPIESLGGQIRAAFFAIDSFDVLVITEFPDDISPSAIAVVFSAGGEVATIHTTRLLDASQFIDAMRKTSFPAHPTDSSAPRSLSEDGSRSLAASAT